MASKRNLSSADQQRYRELLQAATVGALMDSRRWEPGDLAFQGGTSLHLVHGSVRFSEDLDFMVRGGLSLAGLSGEVQRRLQHLPGVPEDMSVTVTDAKDERNPHAFIVTLGGQKVIGSAKVKIELWSTSDKAMSALKVVVRPVASPAGPRVFVPVLPLDEVVADKVYALGARDRLKPRDVFDLWWLCHEHKLRVCPQALMLRLQIYPAPGGEPAQTAERWKEQARKRLADIEGSALAGAVALDLARWLPTYWGMNPSVAAQMLAVSAEQLRQGLGAMLEAYPDQPSAGQPELAPPRRG